MMERQDSTASRSSTSSVKMLLQEKKAFGDAYGGLPTTHHKQWIQYKNQVWHSGSVVAFCDVQF